MSRPPGVNVPLLREVVAAIQVDPQSFYVESWFGRNDCGTTACIAGHTCLLLGKEPKVYDNVGDLLDGTFVGSVAAEALGLNKGQAEALFHLNNWPTPFRELYRDASMRQTHTTMVAVAVARIEHFIQEHAPWPVSWLDAADPVREMDFVTEEKEPVNV